jgi:hypothetical protein
VGTETPATLATSAMVTPRLPELDTVFRLTI